VGEYLSRTLRHPSAKTLTSIGVLVLVLNCWGGFPKSHL